MFSYNIQELEDLGCDFDEKESITNYRQVLKEVSMLSTILLIDSL